MFKEFLIEYIKGCVECSSEEYNLTDENIDNIANIVEGDEHIWEMLDGEIYDELAVYAVEDQESAC